eukprot:TRINITY_DN15_c1_g1_i1.p1 TRINITY_DN15_c1_g1~~TRINITY_DN15_c1_g1_i1.p1  ORF type:complete len:137 (+),score=38.56 TRINITY_DN15_c1_g1_i1:59-412(+)
MPPKAGGKSKQIQASKASAKGAAGGGSKKEKKKWSKGKVKDKQSNKVVFDKETWKKLEQEIPKSKVITPSIISDRLRVNASLARRAIKELAAKGLIKKVADHNRIQIYTRIPGKDEK